MQAMRSVEFKVEPLVTFDLRDWYRSTFDSTLMPDALGQMKPTAIRPRGSVRLIAEAIDGNEAAWPFSGKSELSVQQSPSGLLAFFGRLRLNGSVLAHATRSIPTSNVCKLTIIADGFQRAIIDRLAVPAHGQRRLLSRIELYPSPTYSFSRLEKPVSLLQGKVLDRDGKPVGGASIQLNGAFPVFNSVLHTGPVITSEDGTFLVVLDYLDVEDTDLPIKTPASPVQLSITLGGNEALSQAIPFLPNVRNAIPANTLVIP